MLDENFDSLHGKLFRAQQAQKNVSVNTVYKTYPNVGLNAAVFDIETMNLTAGGNRDHLVCSVFLPLSGGEPIVNEIKWEDQRDDKRLLAEVLETMSQFDILIGHNIAAYDFGWLNTRMMYHEIPQINKRFLYYDTYQRAKTMAIKADRKSLAFLCDFFQVPCVKTSIYPVSWSRVDSSVEKEFSVGLADIVYHCEQDCIANRNLFNAMYRRDLKFANLPVRVL